MFIRLQKTPANKIERYWIVDEIKKIIEREALNRGMVNDEVVSVTIGLDEDQFDTFESYSLAGEFNPLHFLCDVAGYQEDTESYNLNKKARRGISPGWALLFIILKDVKCI